MPSVKGDISAVRQEGVRVRSVQRGSECCPSKGVRVRSVTRGKSTVRRHFRGGGLHKRLNSLRESSPVSQPSVSFWLFSTACHRLGCRFSMSLCLRRSFQAAPQFPRGETRPSNALNSTEPGGGGARNVWERSTEKVRSTGRFHGLNRHLPSFCSDGAAL